MPVEPVPKRQVPDHIPKPDYATESEALESIPARWSGVWGGRVFGQAEEVGRTIAYGLRDVSGFFSCRTVELMPWLLSFVSYARLCLCGTAR